jgi:hypothetical protein
METLHGLVSWLTFVRWLVVTLETHKTQISRASLFLWCSQSGHHPWEDSAKFGYNQDMIILASFYVFHCLLEPNIEIWQLLLLLLLLFWVLVIWNPPKITSIYLLDEIFVKKCFVRLVGVHCGEHNNLSAYLCWIGRYTESPFPLEGD